LFTLLLTLALRIAGMSSLEAVCHAMSSLSTGGFSTSDGSLAKFGTGARWLCVVGMLLGGMNLALFISPWRGKRWRIASDTQIRWYLFTALGFTAILAFWYWAIAGQLPHRAILQAGFQAVSILSTTGFRLSDDMGWGGFPQVAIFVMSFIGGCTGSAAGGIKIFRYEVLFAISRLHIARMLHPHGVFSVTFNRLRLPEAVLRSVLGFFMLYFLCFAALSIGLAVVGLDPLSSLSAAAAAIGNVGAGVGPVIGLAGGYHALPSAAKLLLALGMLIGRLELVPVLVLLLPGFWKD
jgi:trk system potassium uptake protein TrkH